MSNGPTVHRRIRDLPSALERTGTITAALGEARPAVFLDFDGTLAPIMNRPEDASLPAGTRSTLERLSVVFPVAVISGRDLADVRNLVGIDTLYYAGSHGFEMAGPGGWEFELEGAARFLPALEQAGAELEQCLEGIPGAVIERKRFAVAVHFRPVAEDHVPAVHACTGEVASRHPGLRQTGGKQILELRPDVQWNKGKAVEALLNTVRTDSGPVVPLYVGDDLTDEDAFRVVYHTGIGIVVGEDARETAAQYALESPDAVRVFLDHLLLR